jgi:hypothetical protein
MEDCLLKSLFGVVHLEGCYLNDYIKATGTAANKKGPLFGSMRKRDQLTEKPMTRFDVLHMIISTESGELLTEEYRPIKVSSKTGSPSQVNAVLEVVGCPPNRKARPLHCLRD